MVHTCLSVQCAIKAYKYVEVDMISKYQNTFQERPSIARLAAKFVHVYPYIQFLTTR